MNIKINEKENPQLGFIKINRRKAIIPRILTTYDGEKHLIFLEDYYEIERYLERWVRGNGCSYRAEHWGIDFYATKDNLNETLEFIEKDTKRILNSYKSKPPKPPKHRITNK